MCMSTLAERVKAAREHAGLKQAPLAKMVGLNSLLFPSWRGAKTYRARIFQRLRTPQA